MRVAPRPLGIMTGGKEGDPGVHRTANRRILGAEGLSTFNNTTGEGVEEEVDEGRPAEGEDDEAESCFNTLVSLFEQIHCKTGPIPETVSASHRPRNTNINAR